MGKPKKGKQLATRQQLAAALDVHPMTIIKWEQHGMPVSSKGGPGRPTLYDQEAVEAWRAAREESARAETNGDLDPVQERAKKEKFQALIAEQTYLTRQRKLLPADEVARIWRAEVTAVRALILSSYTTHADRVHRAAVTKGLPGVEAELKKLAHEVLRDLADTARPMPDPTSPQSDSVAPPAEAPAPKRGRRKKAA